MEYKNFTTIGIKTVVKEAVDYYSEKYHLSKHKALEKLVLAGLQQILQPESIKEKQVVERIVEVIKPKIVYRVVEHEYRQPKLDARREESKRLFVEEHWTVAKIAKKHGICIRAVYRDLEKMGVVRD